MTVCSYHVTYAFQSESTLYSCLNVKELLARNRREILNHEVHSSSRSLVLNLVLKNSTDIQYRPAIYGRQGNTNMADEKGFIKYYHTLRT